VTADGGDTDDSGSLRRRRSARRNRWRWIDVDGRVQHVMLTFLSARDLVKYRSSAASTRRIVDTHLPRVFQNRGLPSSLTLAAANLLEYALLIGNKNFSTVSDCWIRGPTDDGSEYTDITLKRMDRHHPPSRSQIVVGSRVLVCSGLAVGSGRNRPRIFRGIVVSIDRKHYAKIVTTEELLCDLSSGEAHSSAGMEQTVHLSCLVPVSEPWASATSLSLRGGGPMNFNGVFRPLRASSEPLKPKMISFKFRVEERSRVGRAFCNFFLSSVPVPYKDLETFWLSRPPRPADLFSCLMNVSGDERAEGIAEMWLPSGKRVELRTEDRDSDMPDNGLGRARPRAPENPRMRAAVAASAALASKRRADCVPSWHSVTMEFDWDEETVAFYFDGERIFESDMYYMITDSRCVGAHYFPFTYALEGGDERFDRKTQSAMEAVSNGFTHAYIFTWSESKSDDIQVSISDILVF